MTAVPVPANSELPSPDGSPEPVDVGRAPNPAGSSPGRARARLGRPHAAVVRPADTDPMVAAATERIGGRLGQRVRGTFGFLSPLRILVLLTTLSFGLAYLQKLPCRLESFGGGSNFSRLCYSDIPPLYIARGFAQGLIPYIDPSGDRPLEYPVLTGWFMQLASWITGRGGSVGERTVAFFDVNAVLLFACLMITVLATGLTVRRRPWDAAFVVLAPGTILCMLVNWDMLAVAFTALSMLMWARKHTFWSGLFLGLAIASKFYPLLLLGPLLLLCLRAGRMRAFGSVLVGTVLSWAVVNVPLMLASFDGWAEFYRFSSTRGADWGSIWYVLISLRHPIPADSLNTVATGVLGLLLVGVVVLAMAARRRPRYAQLAFLVVAAFCLTNKVYSPQYVLWLVPLAALARPRWRDFLVWQAGEIVYFVAIWLFLLGYGTGNNNKALDEGWYVAAIVIHLGLTLWFAGMIVRDILRPEHDPIRSDGRPEHTDDPGGGVLDGAQDWLVPRWLQAREEAGPEAVLVGVGAPGPGASDVAAPDVPRQD